MRGDNVWAKSAYNSGVGDQEAARKSSGIEEPQTASQNPQAKLMRRSYAHYSLSG